MSTLTLTANKPLRLRVHRAALPRSQKLPRLTFAEWAAKSVGIGSAKPSKRAMSQAWAKASGIVNTGETDLSTREGFGY